MKETSKALKRLVRDPLWNRMCGDTLDIGGGDDVLPGAERYDSSEGDAEFLSPFPSLPSYHVIYSSHCLEHLPDAETALINWWRFVREGGYLWLIVPDWHLHEHGQWPSRNLKHCHRFSMTDSQCITPVRIARWLKPCVLLRAQLCDAGYDWSRLRDGTLDQSMGEAEVALEMVFWKHTP